MPGGVERAGTRLVSHVSVSGSAAAANAESPARRGEHADSWQAAVENRMWLSPLRTIVNVAFGKIATNECLTLLQRRMAEQGHGSGWEMEGEMGALGVERELEVGSVPKQGR